MDVKIIALVPNAVLPVRAPAATREHVPSGYGVQEQCLPFTAASSLGLLLRSPIDFGLCEPADMPAGGRAFRSPVDPEGPGDSRVFYVKDNPACRFVGNAFSLDPIPFVEPDGRTNTMNGVQPGISFFDRPDQQELFKIHLPFVLRTPAGVHGLFSAALNRTVPLELRAGLVETDWYAHPVNLVARKPDRGALRIAAGDVLGQVVFIAREARAANLQVVAAGSKEFQAMRTDLLQWYARHAQDRSAYKRLARSRHGRIEPKPSS